MPGTASSHWDYIAHLPGHTFVQIPKRHQAKLAAVQNQLLTHIIQTGAESEQSLPYWKAFIMLSWTLLAKPHSTGDNPHKAATIIDDRLTLWELGLHEALHQQTHADTAPQPQRRRARHTHKQQMEARATRITTLVASREISRALDGLAEPQRLVVDHRVADLVQSTFPLATEHPAFADTPGLNADAIDHIGAEVPRALRRMGRLTEPGPLGMRPEHLHSLLDDPA